MSWSIVAIKAPAAEFEAAIDAASLGAGYSADFPHDEAEAQLAAAKAAAKAIFASGCVGSEGDYTAQMSGHAEPGHERREGYSGDTVHVTVQRYVDYSAKV